MAVERRTFLAGGAAALVSTGTAAAQTLQTVRLLTTPSDASKEILYPIQAGLFAKRGIRVEINPMGSGAAMVAAMLGGSADIVGGSLFPVFSAYGHGLPLRVVAPGALYNSDRCDTWLVVRKDSSIQTARDLNGKIIAGDTADTLSVTCTRVWVEQRGGDGKSLRGVELRSPEQLEALDQGRIDMVALNPPWLTVAMQSGKFRVIGKPLNAIAPRFLRSCWISTTDYIAKNPAAVRAFVDVVMSSARWTNEHPAETVAMVAKFTGQDPTLLGQGVRSYMASSITLADIQKPLDFATKYGILDRAYEAKDILAPVMPISGTT